MELAQLQELIDTSSHIVFFGGAGVSTESGIPDFRSVDGLYHTKYEYPPETILSNTFFRRRTEEFYRFYKDKMLYLNARPNAAHKKLAELERANKLSAVITQNIDGLHQAAGSQRVLELHGSVLRNYCTDCGKFYEVAYIMESEGIPRCSCGGIVKPDVVLYEEGLDQDVIRQSVEALEEADLLLVGGTSLAVYPAAGLLDYYKGKHLILINKTSTGRDSIASDIMLGEIGKILEQIKVSEI